IHGTARAVTTASGSRQHGEISSCGQAVARHTLTARAVDWSRAVTSGPRALHSTSRTLPVRTLHLLQWTTTSIVTRI
ncbi:unnamed protein product, partial [Plutella xylostella]